MAEFRKKPVVIEAWQCGSAEPMPQWLYDAIKQDGPIAEYDNSNGTISSAFIKTLEGTMTANAGDWIIRGVKGELYPCKPDIFAATYDAADDEDFADRWCGHKEPASPEVWDQMRAIAKTANLDNAKRDCIESEDPWLSDLLSEAFKSGASWHSGTLGPVAPRETLKEAAQRYVEYTIRDQRAPKVPSEAA